MADLIIKLKEKRGDVSQRIELLSQELRAIDRLILETTVTEELNREGTEVTNRNRRKLYFKGLIRQMLKDEEEKKIGSGLETFEIYKKLQAGDGQNLNYATIRSYIHQLKEDGRIYQNSHSGCWRLTKDEKEMLNI